MLERTASRKGMYPAFARHADSIILNERGDTINSSEGSSLTQEYTDHNFPRRPISASSLVFFTGAALTGSGLPEMPTPIIYATCLFLGRKIRAIVPVGFW